MKKTKTGRMPLYPPKIKTPPQPSPCPPFPGPSHGEKGLPWRGSEAALNRVESFKGTARGPTSFLEGATARFVEVTKEFWTTPRRCGSKGQEKKRVREIPDPLDSGLSQTLSR